MSDFLLELRCEEVPARMQVGARADLEKLLRKELDAAGVTLGAVTVWSTPRRLALIARDLPATTLAVSEELKGPKVGAPPQALEGFLRKTGLSEDQLTTRDGVLYAVTEKPGQATAAVLAEAIPAIIRAFPWPKSQRWGAASLSSDSLRWVRPLSGIVALFDGAVVPCEIGGIAAGRETLGHRFHSSGAISIDGADDYAAKLRAAYVLVDHAERQDLIRAGASKAALDAGLVLVEDAGLVIENAGLTEWPVPLLGRFDAAFLEVPPEVIQLTARTNQKYFVCNDSAGKLANAFVCTANIAASDGGAAIIDGNRKVLAARLSDARFFWEQDRKKTLAQHAEGLARITFHEKLGTVADKAVRVAKLARRLVEQGIILPEPGRGTSEAGGGARGVLPNGAGQPGQENPPVPLHHPADGPPPHSGEELAAQAERAARLCKADLTTEMVGEFPELQGLMGGYYARAEGLPDAVCDAIRDHYKPVGQGDDVPTAPVTVAVSLADKLDTMLGFFANAIQPTGSRDPFALRRAALSFLALVIENNLRFDLLDVLESHIHEFYKEIRVLWLPQYRANRLIESLRENDRNYDVVEEAGKLWLVYANEKQVEISRSDFTDPDDPWSREKSPIEGMFDLQFFLIDRLKHQQQARGVRPDLVRAVFALRWEDDLVCLLARVHALQAFIGTEDGTNLLAGYKRAANLLKIAEKDGETFDQVTDAAPREPEERQLAIALKDAEFAAGEAVKDQRFGDAMVALSKLRQPIDAFFDKVMINTDNEEQRKQRLQLLSKFRAAVHHVADFSKIEG